MASHAQYDFVENGIGTGQNACWCFEYEMGKKTGLLREKAEAISDCGNQTLPL